MTQLQHGLQQHVILVIVGNDHVVDDVREIVVGVSRYLALVGVTEDRVEQDAERRRLDQYAGMAKVSPSRCGAVISLVWRRRLRREERLEQRFLLRGNVDEF